jgi:type VI secretion system secreted protein VgrG
MEITTPLAGDEALLFHTLIGADELSHNSEYHVELLCKTRAIDFKKILGQNVTIKLERAEEETRYFNGFVSRFSAGGRMHGRYHRFVATVSSWLWYTTRRADCRIFQGMTVPDIIKKVLDHYGALADYSFELSGSYRTWDYCVQYRETDFNFASRLLEHEGIHYYFRHSDGKHKLVFTDSVDKLDPYPGYETLTYIDPTEFVRPGVEYVREWYVGQELRPAKYTHTDYDFERPTVSLKVDKQAADGLGIPGTEIYDYPGGYIKEGKDGPAYAEVRIQELGVQFETARALTNSEGVAVGATFKLEGFPRDDENKKHVVIRAEHTLRFSDYEGMPQDVEPTSYQCSFAARKCSLPFRPLRVTPKPLIQGPQTAVVVGPGGDEIFTDKYGRVKVQFHWDRQGKKDDKSSCWVRVSHPWAGKQWGMVAIPRIGQEVVVDFLEGDPDQPIIIGRVYNGEQMPPYELDANKTQSGILSRSSTGGSPANANELMFEDKKGSELIYLRAEKDYTNAVENDEVRWVGNDKWIEVDNDETTFIKHDRTETVDNDETITIHGNRTEVVDKDETITIHMNRTEQVDKDESIVIQGHRNIIVSKTENATVSLQRSHTVGINETITVGAAQEVSVGGAQAITVGAIQATTVGGDQTNAVGGARSVTVGGQQTTTIAKNFNMSVAKDESWKVVGARKTTIGKDDELTVDKKLIVSAADSITFTSGKASITMKKDGTIVIKGKDITIEGSGKINAKATGNLVMKGSKIQQN